jgi:hypothetical protein
MSYQGQSLLTYDDAFNARSRACLVEQANGLQSDARADVAALARNLLTEQMNARWATWQSMLPTSPGFVAAVENPDGTIDSTKITDGQLLSAVQAGFPQVAALYYNPDGTPVA